MRACVFLAVATLVVAGCATTTSPQRPTPPTIEARQAMLALQMVKAAVKDAFDKSDLNGDNSLSKEEMVEFGLQMALVQAQRLAPANVVVLNLTEAQMRQEITKDIERNWENVDVDRSGGLSIGEILKSMLGDLYIEDEVDTDESA